MDRNTPSIYTLQKHTLMSRTNGIATDNVRCAQELPNRSPAPPIPGRAQKPVLQRPLKPAAQLPNSMNEQVTIARTRGGGSVGGSMHYETPPPIPLRSPITPRSGVHLVSCPPPPSQSTSGRHDASTGSPARMVMIDARKNSGHSAMVHSAMRGRRTSAATPRESRSTPSKSAAQASDPQIVSVSQWPIRQVPPSNLSLDGANTPASARQRRVNEYVDSPSLMSGAPASSTEEPGSSLPELFRPHGPGINLRDCHDNGNSASSAHSERGGGSTAVDAPQILKRTEKQPVVCQEGIVCSRCGRCRCSNCAQPRELPRHWVGEHECSAAKTVEACTCMCCVRALFFHTRRSEDEDYSDDPCACFERPACCGRWATMGLLAMTCLPCLLCYWPLRCAVGACTSCYNSYRVIGCRCEHGTLVSGTKGLLTPESESSSY